jgi:histidinol dehydrogenase
MADVAGRGDEALVESCRKFDDPNFTAEQIRVRPEEMREAAGRVTKEQSAALRRSIAQVREYQSHVMPKAPPALTRPGVELGIRFTPLESAGLYFPGGKAAYPSSLAERVLIEALEGMPDHASGTEDQRQVADGLVRLYERRGDEASAARYRGLASSE